MVKYKYIGKVAGRTYIRGPRGAEYTVNLHLALRNEKRPMFGKNDKLRGYVSRGDIEK